MNLIIITSFIVFISWFIQGISGFGSAIFMVTFLSFFINIKSVVLTFIFIQALGPLSILLFVKKPKFNILTIIYLLIGSLIGIIMGTYILKTIDIKIMEIPCGLFFISIGLFDILSIFKKELSIFSKLKPKHGILVGIFSGIFSALAGTGGPPVAIYLRNITKEFDEYRFLISLYAVLIVGIRLIVYILMDAFQDVKYQYILWWATASLLGFWAGRYTSKFIKNKHIHLSVPFLVLICGILLLIKA